MKKAPKMEPKLSGGGRPKNHTFRDLVFYVDFMLNLVTILVPFGALWLTLAPFWLTFGALWLTFGALGVTFAHPGARFTHFWCLLASFFIFLCTLGENLM